MRVIIHQRLCILARARHPIMQARNVEGEVYFVPFEFAFTAISQLRLQAALKLSVSPDQRPTQH